MTDVLTRPVRYVRLPGGPVVFGGLAGTDVMHPFAPDTNTGTLCTGCYGWCDDPRHSRSPSLPPAVN